MRVVAGGRWFSPAEELVSPCPGYTGIEDLGIGVPKSGLGISLGVGDRTHLIFLFFLFSQEKVAGNLGARL